VASKRFRNNVWEYVIKRAGVLDKPRYFTFDSEEEGDAFCAHLEAFLDKGIVAPELQSATKRVTTLNQLARDYELQAHPSTKDRLILDTLCKTKGNTRLVNLNVAWVDSWISSMKRIDQLSPATIRAKVGALARCTDWGLRQGHLLMPDHPFRSLPEGYAQYNKLDAAVAGKKKIDIERDRRLEGDEYENILALIEVGVLPRKYRPLTLQYKAALRCLMILAVASAMRLREMYTLTLGQVNLEKRTIFLEKTKNGDKRQVPLSTVALAALREYLAVRAIPQGHPEDLLFPWWNGKESEHELRKATDKLSTLFVDIFEAAGAHGLKFHDLRHEAVSRLFENTALPEISIMKISGHRSHRMMMRYANLRGSNLADALG
jgi:integrase